MSALDLMGYRRAQGGAGARNHVLVLPSVVCSTRVAEQVAGDEAVSVTHQHGCGQVGDDVKNSSRLFVGMATNPNVAGVVVVGLGCETIGGPGLAEEIARAHQHVAFVGIQACGGSAATVAAGTAEREALVEAARRLEREPVAASALRVGLDDPSAPFAASLAAALEEVGASLVLPGSSQRGELAHAELAAAGVTVIVAWCGPGVGPRSFPVVPVLSVSGDPVLAAALGEDFDDLVEPGDTAVAGARLAAAAAACFSGKACAAERRGAAEFTLPRLARSM